MVRQFAFCINTIESRSRLLLSCNFIIISSVTLNEFLKTHTNLKLVSDSRSADSESLFVAIRGSTSDGHKYLQSVYDQGCRHFIVEEDSVISKFKSTTFLKVESTRKAWSQAWRLKSITPDQDLTVLAVTGTNGKTSITLMIEHILNASNISCAVMGTIDHHLKLESETKIWPSNLTTPGAEILYPRLSEMKALGAQAVALEISSHALDQNRAEELQLDVAIFSNLTEDHLDYHPDLNHYYESKLKLFEKLLQESSKSLKVSVLNYMDPWVRRYEPKFGLTEILVEGYQKLEDFGHNVRTNILRIKKHSLSGLEFELQLDARGDIKSSPASIFNAEPKMKSKMQASDKSVLNSHTLKFNLPVMGHFQALNWCQAVLACIPVLTSKLQATQTKEDMFAKIQNAAKSFTGVPGRLQKVLTEKPKAVFVDYAHTPDALERTLKSLRDICEGKLIVIFGCGGDRDKAKRPLMAKVAEQYSDIQIITNDNPRTEDPKDILQDILSGFSSPTADSKAAGPQIELDRKKAISQGLNLLKSSKDVLLIAGKGHEDYQILKNETIQFSDYAVALELLNS